MDKIFRSWVAWRQDKELNKKMNININKTRKYSTESEEAFGRNVLEAKIQYPNSLESLQQQNYKILMINIKIYITTTESIKNCFVEYDVNEDTEDTRVHAKPHNRENYNMEASS